MRPLHYLEQWFKADVDIKLTADEQGFSVTLSNVEINNERIQVLTVDHDGAIKRSAYQTFDTTAVQTALATGATSILKMRWVGGATSVAYKVNSVDEDPETGAVTLNAWNTGVPTPTGSTAGVGAFVGVTVSVTVVTPQDVEDFWPNCERQCQSMFTPSSSDSNSGTGILTISDVSDGEASDKLEFIQNLSGLIKGRVPVLIKGKRAGCNNVKTMIGIVDRICVDGKRIELIISKKGLKSKGCAAKKAVAGFTSGAYQLQSIEPAGTIVIANSSNPGSWITIALQGGTLTKTDVLGTYTLKFASGEKVRVFNYDEEKKEVSSISVDDYFKRFAQTIGGSGALIGGLVELRPWKERGAGAVPVAGADPVMFGILSRLTPSTPGDGIDLVWNATVKLPFACAAGLGDEIKIESMRVVVRSRLIRPSMVTWRMDLNARWENV